MIIRTLIGLDCPAPTHAYLGDGVYAGMQRGGTIILAVNRDSLDSIHWVALEPEVLASLNVWIERLRTAT